MAKARTNFAKISDEKIKEKTTKTWKQWFKIIDALDLEAKGHRAVVMTLLNKYKLNPWWSQAVTIHYEWEHGFRTVKNQRQATPDHPIFKNPSTKRIPSS